MRIKDCEIDMTIIGAKDADNYYNFTRTGAICQIKEIRDDQMLVRLIKPVSGHIPKNPCYYLVEPEYFDIYKEVKIEIEW